MSPASKGVTVGLMLAPSVEFLELLANPIDRSCGHYEVTPETLWYPNDAGVLRPNGYHAQFLALARRTQRPFLAHGLSMSFGSVHPSDASRRGRLLSRLAKDHALFRFRWYTDHLGANTLAGEVFTLPTPLPMNDSAASLVRARLKQVQRLVPDVGVENNVPYYCLGDPLEEPAFLNSVVSAPRTHLLLDLHNLYTFCVNFDIDPLEYLARLDLDRVIELHLSGGRQSERGWLKAGATLRLDSHDTAVPESVWDLYRWVLPRCPRLRAVTIERMEGTLGADAEYEIDTELRRARRMLNDRCVRSRPRNLSRKTSVRVRERPSRRSRLALERLLANAFRSADPIASLRAQSKCRQLTTDMRQRLSKISAEGIELTSLLILRVRFERLMQGSTDAARWFEAAPEDFTRVFREYHLRVRPTELHAQGEARLFFRWLGKCSEG